jgi:hypothetical protein
MADVDPKQAAAKLERYLQLQSQYDKAVECAFANRPPDHGWDPRTSDQKQAFDSAIHEREATRTSLLHIADEVARVLARVKITSGFSVKMPERDFNRDYVNRGVGEYARWIETGRDPNPPAVQVTPAQTDKLSESKPKRKGSEVSLMAAIVAGALSGAGTGLGASLLTSFYGAKQTCIAGDEVLCAPRNGVAHARVCTEDGRRYGPCMPVDTLTLTNNNPAEPPPVVVAPPGDGSPAKP